MKFLIVLTITLVLSNFFFLRDGLSNTRTDTFKSSYAVGGSQLNLRGVALKKSFFIKAFFAGFYLKEDVLIDEVFNNVPKRIEVVYFIHISRERLSDFTEHLMKKNVTPEQYDLMASRIQRMREYFCDLQPGDRYALTYVPGVGTRFEFNDQLRGVIDGEEFAAGLFATWIGEHPMDRHIKEKILGLSSLEMNDELELVLE